MIFRKLLKRESRVIVAVEADDIKEANKTFEEWYNNDDNIESTSQLLAEREKDSEEWMISFGSWEEYNRSQFACADFIIEKKDDEPRYDVAIICNNSNGFGILGKREKITLEQMLDYVGSYNKDYKLTILDALFCNERDYLSVISELKQKAKINNSKLIVFKVVDWRN